MSFWHAEQKTSQPGGYGFSPQKEVCVGSTGREFYMGGAAMATHIWALEHHFDRPLYWATTQFLNHGLLGEKMELTVESVSGGRSVVQALAEMRRGNDILHRTIAALGRREGTPDQAFIKKPESRPPLECPLKKEDAMTTPGNLLTLFERRTASEDPVTGKEHMWIRPLFESRVDSALLALISDFFLGAHLKTRGGTSLDNTFRVINLVKTDWMMMVTQLSSFTRGAVHGHTHIFSEEGILLATSSQTGLLPRMT